MSYRCSLPSPLQERSKEISEIVGDVHTEWRCYFGQGGQEGAWGNLQRMSLCGALPLGSAKVKENSKAQILQNFNVILCNLWISSAMAMSMSIYRTLCVLVCDSKGHLKFYHTPRDTKCFWQCPWLTDSRTFTEGNFSTSVSSSSSAFFPLKFHS